MGDIMDTHMLTTARGLLNQWLSQRLTQKLIPICYMVDTMDILMPMDIMDTHMLTMARDLQRLNQLLRLIQRLIPTCYTVDTMDILILMDIMVIHTPHILESKLKSLMPMFLGQRSSARLRQQR